MKKPIYIIGAGGLGREINAMLLLSEEWEVMGFYDDGLSIRTIVDGISVIGSIKHLAEVKNPVFAVIAIASPVVKSKIASVLAKNPAIYFPALIHPSVQLLDAKKIKIGIGSIVTAGCVLTTQIMLGNHVLVNLNTTIGHDSILGDYSSVMPGVNIAGQVTIGREVLIGSGSNIRNGISIGANSVVGSGAVVTKNVREAVVVVGAPAKELQK